MTIDFQFINFASETLRFVEFIRAEGGITIGTGIVGCEPLAYTPLAE